MCGGYLRRPTFWRGGCSDGRVGSGSDAGGTGADPRRLASDGCCCPADHFGSTDDAIRYGVSRVISLTVCIGRVFPRVPEVSAGAAARIQAL